MKTFTTQFTKLTAVTLLACALTIPAAARNINKVEWYVRLTVNSDAGLQDKSNILGQLKDSYSGYDSHDLKELPPFGNHFLTIVFPHEEWEGDASGDYSSDYHDRLKNDEWAFEVYTSEVVSDITLAWDATILPKKARKKKKAQIPPQDPLEAQLEKEEDMEKLMGRMMLEDAETGEVFPVESVENYTFNMNGKSTRQFRWIKNKKLTKKWKRKAKRAARKTAKALHKASAPDDLSVAPEAL